MMPNASRGLAFLFKPDWSALTPAAFLIALGQSFFTLSLGQGTMVTYGSYLGSNDNLEKLHSGGVDGYPCVLACFRCGIYDCLFRWFATRF